MKYSITTLFKRFRSSTTALGLILFFMAMSCQNEDSPKPNTKEISTTDVNALAQVLVFPNATKQVNDAVLPPSSVSDAPKVVNYDKNISYSSGSKIIIPTDIDAMSNLKGVYVQVKGSNSYFDVPITGSITNGTVALPFTLPSTILDGTFVLLLKFYDINGKISAAYEVTITVTKPSNCGVTKVSGGQGLTSNLFKLSNTPGKIKISYETFVVKDKIDVFQNGLWIGGTGALTDRSLIRKALNCSVATEAKGYVGQKAEFLFDYNPLSGDEIEVVVSGCEDGGTKWEYVFSCPGATPGGITIPELTTTSATSITSAGAISGGNITNDKGSAITARGVVWSTSPNPTIALTTKTSDGNGKGSYISTIGGLTTNTKYFVRAYATNAAGTAYGNEVSFTTATVVNLSLDGQWKSSAGTGVTITGATGVFYAFSSAWQNVATKGLVSIGSSKFKNISSISAGKWNTLDLWHHTSNGQPVAVTWSTNGTITMSNDGKSITVTSTVTYSGQTETGSLVYLRQ